MKRPGRPGTRAVLPVRFSRVARAVAQPFASLRTQIVLLVAFATLLISLLATWVSTTAVEEFLASRLEARFPAQLVAKSREVRLWYDRVGLNLSTLASDPVVRRTVSELVRAEPGDARLSLNVQLVRALSRESRYSALVICTPAQCPLVAAGSGIASAARELDNRALTQGSRSYGIVERGRSRRQLLAVPIPNVAGASLRAMIELRELDRLLATGITQPSVELYVVDAAGRYVAGTQGALPRPLFYRGPGPQRSDSVTVYANDHGERVFGAARPVGRFGWTMVVEQQHAAIAAPVRVLVGEIFRFVLVGALLLVVVAIVLALSIVRPLEALSATADRAAAGDADTDLPRPRGASELRRLTQAFNEMTLRIGSSRRELERRAAELEHLSITDGLTGVYNHRHFQEQLPLEAKRAERAGLSLALILVDIDDFKAINDTFGHAVGDGILCQVAQVMTDEVRAIDVVARYGGEEFAVLTQQKDAAGAVTLADKIRHAIGGIEYELPESVAAPVAGGGILRLTVSIGVGLCGAGDEPEAVFDAADAALYAAKQAGKNRVELARQASLGRRRGA